MLLDGRGFDLEARRILPISIGISERLQLLHEDVRSGTETSTAMQARSRLPDWFGKKKEEAPLHGARIEEYALIGDCETAALVSREGSIDWLCWPAFSSPACFAALLGTAENGYWKIRPKDEIIQIRRRYRPGTMIVETTFETAKGEVDRKSVV